MSHAYAIARLTGIVSYLTDHDSGSLPFLMHVIRLHGPWSLEITANEPGQPERVHLPRDWAKVGEAGRQSQVTLVRRFHRPTGLSQTTRVALTLPAGWPVVAVTVNEKRLPTPSIVEQRRVFDLSAIVRLREAHDLRIEFEPGNRLLEQPYLVALEIHETDD